MSEKKLQKEIIEAVARGWCYPKNSKKEFDADLALAISEEIHKIAHVEWDQDKCATCGCDRMHDCFECKCHPLIQELQEARQTIEKQKAAIAEKADELKSARSLFNTALDQGSELLAILDECEKALEHLTSGNHDDIHCGKGQEALASLREWKSK